uniref:Ig-like domain-containing protein n=1 Tax=Castor canadensis TaxID=51338 RepID=A0A8C0X0L9_CASCN
MIQPKLYLWLSIFSFCEEQYTSKIYLAGIQVFGFWLLLFSILLVWGSPVTVPVPTAHFLQQVKHECYFSNGTERVRLVDRYIYNQEELVHYDSDVGEFIAMTELGRPEAESWNSQKDILEDARAADTTMNSLRTTLKSSKYIHRDVTVYPTKTQPLNRHNLLVCSVSGFYPGQIEVRWFQNIQEEEEAGVVSTGLIQNGDWTFQTLVMLEAVPQSGEVYTCQVEHPSLKIPVTVEWRAQSGSAQSKMLSGVGGFVLGLLFLGIGLFIYFRNPKGKKKKKKLLVAETHGP